MNRKTISIQEIDDLLPQTQCGDCGYAGCLPYAVAIKNGDSLNKCLPGGVKVLQQLGNLLEENVTSYIEDLDKKTKPKRLASIREDECIGCTKCINACPVDAIIGATKQMHTVINQECTGCGLCMPPCPMDCIDLIITPDQNYHPEHARKRYQNRLVRLQKQAEEKLISSSSPKNSTTELDQTLVTKQAAIAAAISRSQAKRKQ